MVTLNELLIAEVTEHEFKSALEVKKPKSWLKTISAYANGMGGSMYFGVSNDGIPVKMDDIQKTAEDISRFIKERIAPLPEVNLTVHHVENDIDVLILRVSGGNNTPYYYVGDGTTTAFVRVGNESVPASPQQLNELVMRGKNLTFDTLPTDYKLSDLTFTSLNAAFKRIKKITLTNKDYVSMGMCKPDGTINHAGIMFSDECPLLQSRIFCTRWDGLDKAGGIDDALDDKEYEGDLISQLLKSHEFVLTNSKVRWKKMSNHRVNKPDYADRAVFEALANALMHRDYTVVGSEVHVAMYDDRLEIYSPGGMLDGTLIQEQDIEEVPSIRRNPVIAEIFHRLDFVERRGSGFKKIREATAEQPNYTEELAPSFKSTRTTFHAILRNMNYNMNGTTDHVTDHVTVHDNGNGNRTTQLLEFCSVPRSREEMQEFIGISHRGHFRTTILVPLLNEGKLKMTEPEKPKSKNQKYVRA